VISTSGWEPARAVPEQFDGAINWLEGKVDDGTFDCIYGFMEGGRFQRRQRRFAPRGARPDGGLSAVRLVSWDVRPLLEFKEGVDTLRAKLVEAQAAMAGR
jgi:hypothetical protein